MSWFKNLWSRVFAADGETAEYAPEEQRETKPAAGSRQAPFRFPLIRDDEKDAFFNGEAPEEMRPEIQAPPRQSQNGQPVSMAGRGPQARRYIQEETYEPALPKPRPRPVPVERPALQVRPARPAKPEAPAKTGPSRRYEPTRVPSPVYGYQEPRPLPIQELLERKTEAPPVQETEKPVAEQTARVIRSKPEESGMDAFVNEVKLHTSAERQAARARLELSGRPAPIVQPTSEPAEKAPEPPLAEPPVIEKEEIPEEKQAPAEPVVVIKEEIPEETQKAVEAEQTAPEPASIEPAASEPIEPEPIAPAEPAAVQQQEPEQEPQERIVISAKQPEKKPATAEPKAQTGEKKVPFNVLMLKSDKEKLKKRAEPKPAAPQKTVIEKPAAPEPATPAVAVENEPAAEAPQTDIVTTAIPETVYSLPNRSSLRPPEEDLVDTEWMEEQGARLIEALSHFYITAEIVSIVQGPAVTQFELTVAQGVKVSKIRNLADDLKLALAARDIRIQAPIPGKSSIGIEIPNRKSRPVRISEVIGSEPFIQSDSPMEAALGLDLTGKPISVDLRKMPHGLIAGATGSGKSVCINSILISLLYKSAPRDLKLLLIDPKMVELAPYNHIPHLLSPVITDVKAATASLKWAVEEMERRYQLFAHTGVRDIARYNRMVESKGQPAQHLPHILIVIDELADLMMAAPSDVEESICRIAQKARACGIHLIIATQRPSVDVITGLIKSNIPARIAFSVSSQVDSRTILDSQGAERLLGKGDMLYLGNGMSSPVRMQGTFVTDEEIEQVIDHVRSQGEPDYIFKEEELIRSSHLAEEQDELFEEACRLIVSQGSASTSMLQRHFRIGYNRAARLMDTIEEQGVISVQNGSKPRAVLMTEEDVEEVFQ